jgi:hypothetical protein
VRKVQQVTKETPVRLELQEQLVQQAQLEAKVLKELKDQRVRKDRSVILVQLEHKVNLDTLAQLVLLEQ